MTNNCHIYGFSIRFFSPIQLIYNSKTKRCLPKYDFPNSFDVTFTPNHWSNFEKCVSCFEKIIFPSLKAKKEELGYLKELYSLIVMGTFKLSRVKMMPR